jgi:hypothetical protein
MKFDAQIIKNVAATEVVDFSILIREVNFVFKKLVGISQPMPHANGRGSL